MIPTLEKCVNEFLRNVEKSMPKSQYVVWESIQDTKHLRPSPWIVKALSFQFWGITPSPNLKTPKVKPFSTSAKKRKNPPSPITMLPTKIIAPINYP